MCEKPVLLEKKDNIATITMNRPQTLNSLQPVLIDELVNALISVQNDDSVKVAVLTGAGRAFCAGGDLTHIETIDNPVLGRDYILKAAKIVSTIVNMEKPVIAMVNGVAAGAGFNIALACDIIFCAKSARFGQSFAKIGLIPDCGGTYFLPRVVGLHKTKELMFTGDLIDADTALKLGIVNQVIDDAELKETTYEFAEKLATGAPIALALTKKALNQSFNLNLEGALELEASLQCNCLQTQDKKEGIKAFKEKRAPVFKGI